MFDGKVHPCGTRNTVKFRFTMSYGDYLREKLSEKDMTAAELARRSGLTKQNLGRILNNTPHWQTGKAPTVSVEFVDRTATALGVDLDEARLAAGYAPTEPGIQFSIGFDAAVKLGTDVSPDEQQEIAEELALAYEVIMARRKRRLAQND